MKSWIRNRSLLVVLLGGGVAIFVVVGALWFGATAYYMRQASRASVVNDASDRLQIDFLRELDAAEDFLLVDAADAGFLATGKARTLDEYDARLAAVRADLDALERGESEQALAAKVREGVDAFDKDLRALVGALRSRDAANAGELRTRLIGAGATVTTVLDEMSNQAGRESALARESVMRASTIVFALGLVLAALFFYFFVRAIVTPIRGLGAAAIEVGGGDLSRALDFEGESELGNFARGFNRMIEGLRELVGRVQESGLRVNTSVAEIAATAKQQQATATEIAATTSEIGATSKEISATSRELVKTMGEVSAVAEQSALLAGSGQAGLAQMEEGMQRVVEATGSINAKLAALSEKAGNIGQVVTTITKVADQTNLLSLNAAIEAEKAGDYGRGFAVVALEIRRLADQTSIASYDIEQMVKEIQSAVAASVMGVDKFSEEVHRGMQSVQQVAAQLAQIIQQVQTLAPRVEAVNEGMQAQATGAGQITEALSQLSEAAQQTVESLRQSTIAIEELNQVAGGLRSGVSRFRLQA